VVSGLLNKQAAARLGISEVTLQIHRARSCIRCRPSRWPSWCGWPGRWESPLRSPARRSMTFVVAVVDDDRGSSSPSKTCFESAGHVVVCSRLLQRCSRVAALRK